MRSDLITERINTLDPLRQALVSFRESDACSHDVNLTSVKLSV
jgi:hypothetical protein